MRVAVIGNSGSGKSTLARQLATAHSLPMLDLDTVAWEPGKIAVARDPLAAALDVNAFCSTGHRWIVEGCYAALARAALPYASLLLFLDPGVDVCLANCRDRPWEPHKYESKEVQDQHLELLLTWVREYYTREDDASLFAHQALFDEYRGPKHKLTARVEVDQLDALTR
jgi:adenylate kinase family enzyme